MLMQVASGSQPPLLVAHSLTSVQVVPSPVNPFLQVQVRLPAVFEQVAFTSQPPLAVAHSLMSVQVVPLPVNPALHAHV